MNSIFSLRSCRAICFSAIFCLGFLVAFSGCDPAEMSRLLDVNSSEATSQPNPGGLINPTSTTNNNGTADAPTRFQSLIIGSFNIQTFGRSKMNKPEVVPVLIDIARRFDILAIQELRDKDETTIPEFIKLVNQNGANFRAAVSRRVGYVDQKTNRQYEEQLVYIYDANRIEIISEPYVAQDRYALMHRPPYVAHFRCRSLPPEQAFSFVLMNVHTDPDDTVGEFTALQDIIHGVFPNHPGEDDFILLGDMNDEASKFSKYRWFANQFATIPSHWKTNTRQNKSYDNIIFDTRRTAEFMNQGGVLNLMQEYRINQANALLVSDHMPVWAVFSTREMNPSVLTQGPQVLR